MLLALALSATLLACATGTTPPANGRAPRESSVSPSMTRPGSCVPSDGATTPTQVEVLVAGTTRTARVHVPASLDPATSPPLMLLFHGFAGSPEEMERATDMSTKADEEGFVAVYPQGIGSPPAWELRGSQDARFVAALLPALAAQVCFDPGRVYATGFSMGGGMATVLGCRMADRIAAIAPVSGVNLPDEELECRPSRAVPMIAFHGVLDELLPYDGGRAPGRYPHVVAAETAAAAWAERNGCDTAVERRSGPIDTVNVLAWSACDAPVELYSIINRGHTWPGSPLDVSAETAGDISATDLIWDFVSRHAIRDR